MARYLKQAEGSAPQSVAEVAATVRTMLDAVANGDDGTVLDFARRLDGWSGATTRVSDDDILAAERALPETFKDDFAVCQRNVTDFARRQRDSIAAFEAEIAPGIVLGQKLVPVERVGCYVPGGKYPLVSAAIMSVGTARVAGVGHIVACAPPRGGAAIYPATLYALHRSGADEIHVLGGVQAIAAMVFGRLGIVPVDMVTGPGNAYVAEAKRQLFGRVGIDLLAGPTEILIIADDGADPALVATDLLGQAEHGPDSPAWLVTTSQRLGEAVAAEIETQLPSLPTADVAGRAWRQHGEIVIVDSDEEAAEVSDRYAPEHLQVMSRDPDWFLARLRNYGSLFLGEEATVAYGDKGVGTNHTLPTGRAARYTGGLWAGKFIKTVTYQRLTAAASRQLAPVIARICEVENLPAHQATADVRYARFAPRNVEPAAGPGDNR